MLRTTMYREIEKIPGEQGWYREDNAGRFRKLGDELITAGMDPAEALDLLTEAYGAVASEFGA